MNWRDIQYNGQNYSMGHLQPFFVESLNINGTPLKLRITFSHHVFTDEKGNGHMIKINNEERFFCRDRYDLSHELPKLIVKSLEDRSTYVTAFKTKKGERYYHLFITDYVVFMELRKPAQTDNMLRLHIVSAYGLENWGRSKLPNGTSYRFHYVLEKRLKGESVLKKTGKKKKAPK